MDIHSVFLVPFVHAHICDWAFPLFSNCLPGARKQKSLKERTKGKKGTSEVHDPTDKLSMDGDHSRFQFDPYVINMTQKPWTKKKPFQSTFTISTQQKTTRCEDENWYWNWRKWNHSRLYLRQQDSKGLPQNYPLKTKASWKIRVKIFKICILETRCLFRRPTKTSPRKPGVIVTSNN